MSFKDVLKLWVLGDTKRPPQYYIDFKSPTFSNFGYSCIQDGYGKPHVHMRIELGDALEVKVSWSAKGNKWSVLLISDAGSMSYCAPYAKFHPDVKRIVDFMCDAAEREYVQEIKRNAISQATREIKLFKEILPRLDALEEALVEKVWESQQRKMNRFECLS